jgi:hypothetical protein
MMHHVWAGRRHWLPGASLLVTVLLAAGCDSDVTSGSSAKAPTATNVADAESSMGTGTASDKQCPRSAQSAITLTMQMRAAFADWFECDDECESLALATMIESTAAKDPLVHYLGDVAKNGAPYERCNEIREGLRIRYKELVAYGSEHPDARPASANEDEFIAMYIANLHAQYRTQAATALGIVGGHDAALALKAAPMPDDREDVRAAFDRALTQISRRRDTETE